MSGQHDNEVDDCFQVEVAHPSCWRQLDRFDGDTLLSEDMLSKCCRVLCVVLSVLRKIASTEHHLWYVFEM